MQGLPLLFVEKHIEPENGVFSKRDLKSRVCSCFLLSFIAPRNPTLEGDKGTLADLT